jgi:hypothetical protein
MDNTHSGCPQWFTVAEALRGPLFDAAHGALRAMRWRDTHAAHAALAALLHVRGVLRMCNEANAHGEHSVAAGLIRQSLEPLTLVEFGLQPEQIGAAPINAWHDGTSTIGELRRAAERALWPTYGTGLWDETWSHFFSQLSKAVQPYAHYSQPLMLWQFHTDQATSRTISIGGREAVVVAAHIGPDLNDRDKTWQVSLLQALVHWTLGRILGASAADRAFVHPTEPMVRDLGAALAASEYLATSDRHWAVLLLPVIGTAAAAARSPAQTA